MKLLVLSAFLSLLAIAAADTKKHERGCIYILGKCKEECPEGTHAYATGCSQLLPEATCDEPHPVLEQGSVCDYSSCYCDPPTVRDPVSKKCVKLEECPKKE